MKKLMFFIICLLSTLSLAAATVYTPDAPGTVFFHGTPLFFKTDTAAGGKPCNVIDWQGNICVATTWRADGTILLSPLPPGYYRLICPEQTPSATTFAIIPPPLPQPFDYTSFFAMDTAFSWLAMPSQFQTHWYDGDSYRLAADLLQWMGVTVIRERLRWSTVSRKPDEFDFNRNRYLQNADMLSQRGLKLSGMFHDVPAYSEKTTRLTRDMKLQYDLCYRVAETFDNRMFDWEFWNEQDFEFTSEPVWDYVACLKAAYLGFKAARPNKIVAPGAICLDRRNDYDRIMYENDAALYCDLLNMHTYRPLAYYTHLFQDLHAFMADAGIASRPIWMTEWNAFLYGACNGPEELITHRREHSYEQELLVAETFVKGMTLQWMHGVSKSFMFIFLPYKTHDINHNCSIIRRDGSVKAVYVAATTMARQLVSAKLLGELVIGKDARAFLFEQPDGSQSVLFWAVSSLETSMKPVKLDAALSVDISLPLPMGTYTLTDCFGASSSVEATLPRTTLKASRFPTYLSGLHNLKADTNAHPQGSIQPQKLPADFDPTVIIRVDLKPDEISVTNCKSLAELIADTPHLTLSIWNLSDTAKQGSLVVSGGTLQGLPETLSLPHMGKITFETIFHPVLPPGQFDGKLILTGSFNGKSSSRFVMPYKCINQYLNTLTRMDLDAMNPHHWKRFDSASETTISYDENEHAIRFDTHWNNPEVDRWFYPKFTLNLPLETRKRIRYICFDIKSSQDKPENAFSHNFVSFMPTHDPKLKSYRFDYVPPQKEWESRRIELTARKDFDWTAVKAMTLGGNPKGQSLTLWLRNIHFFLADE